MVTDYIGELVKFLEEPKLRCFVIFGTRDNDSPLKLWKADVKDVAREQFRQGFLAEAKKLKGKKPEMYSLSDEESDSYLYITIKEIPDGLEYLKDAESAF